MTFYLTLLIFCIFVLLLAIAQRLANQKYPNKYRQMAFKRWYKWYRNKANAKKGITNGKKASKRSR